MILTKVGFKKRRGNSINDVKLRLWITFSTIAITTSFVVFLAFGLRLVMFEESQIEKLLASFKQVAINHYQLVQEPFSELSEHVSVYYGDSQFDETISAMRPFRLNDFTKNYSFTDFEPNIGPENGLVVYHFNFDYQDEIIPTYITVSAIAIDFGDDNWDALLGISMLLIVFLITVLRFSLKRVFDGLMSPITDLTEQLAEKDDAEFTTSERATDELKLLASHLNSYKKMKERVSKQELMFAKYASHELKTPIAIVLGAANLQAMSEDPEFQAKQRERIIKAGDGMQETVEVLLNIVKQENADTSSLYDVNNCLPQLERYKDKLDSPVSLKVNIDEQMQINLPPAVLSIVIKNLVENAIRFTSKGEISVTISDQAISVRDTGKGLTDAQETEHGLGLLIIRRICQSYGWQFGLVNNVDGRGCTAAMTLSSKTCSLTRLT